eukprot:1977702-Pleurochrysis_carterae.AAC.1
MNSQVRRPAIAKMGYLGPNQERCSKRCAKFQKRGGSGRGAMPTCGLDDNKRCNDALQTGLAQGR